MQGWRSDIRRRLVGARLSRAREAEVVEELSQHLQDRFDELRAAGEDDVTARATALAELDEDGTWPSEPEAAAMPIGLSTGGATMRGMLWQDVRYALRTLRKTPGFSAVVILTLALGIGATTAIFSVLDGVLIRPMPYPDIERMLTLTERTTEGRGMSVSWPDFQDWRDQNQVFEYLGVYRPTTATLTGGDQPERLNASSGVLRSVRRHRRAAARRPGVRRGGRSARHRSRGRGERAALAQSLWRRPGAGRPRDHPQRTGPHRDRHHAGGDALSIAADRRLAALRDGDPRVPSEGRASGPHRHRQDEAGRVAAAGDRRHGHDCVAPRAAVPGLEQEHAGQHRSVLRADRAQHSSRTDHADLGGWLRPADRLREPGESDALKAEGRRREIAIRAALGAERRRIVQQLLVESLLLAAAGGAIGAVLASWAVNAFVASQPTTVPRIDLLAVDGRVLIFTAGISILTGIVFGLVPALRASSLDLLTHLKDSARGFGLGSQRVRSVLVVTEVAMTVVLLVGAGLMARSFMRLMAVDPGFNPERVVTVRLNLPDAKYPDGSPGRPFIANCCGAWRRCPASTASA